MNIFTYIFYFLNYLDTFFWCYIGFVLIVVLGIYLSIKHRFFQLFKLFWILKEFVKISKSSKNTEEGIHPLKVFFSSVGGMIGIGNVVGIITAVQIGGPGALFWVWVAAPLGAIIKYSEIFLGMKYRVKNGSSFDGGPMFFVKKAFSMKALPSLICVLLCIYGVEVYQFNVVCESISRNVHIDKIFVVFFLLTIVLYAAKGGIKRIAQICTFFMPIFMVLYTFMCLYIVFSNFDILSDLVKLVFKSAFFGQKAVKGFAGAGIGLAIKEGISRAVYSGDIGIGYDSVMNSQSSIENPSKQGLFSIVGMFLDNFICTLSILVILTTYSWHMGTNVEGTKLVQMAFERYFPYMNVFMPVFIFLTGYSTIISYFAVGMKTVGYLKSRVAKYIYFFYAVVSLVAFSFVSQKIALLIMSLSSGFLVLINLLTIFKLRNEIEHPFVKKYFKKYKAL